MSTVQKDLKTPNPIISAGPVNTNNSQATFLEPPPLDVQISPANLDYHEPPPSPNRELPPKPFPEIPDDDSAPIICICPPYDPQSYRQ